MVIALLTFLASRMKTAARWNSPERERWLRSPEIATTSNLRSWMIRSMASICSGTAGQPKWRSETWKTVVTSSGGDDEIREMVRDALRQRRRHRLHRIARYLSRPFYEGHARIHHHHPQGRNAHTSAVVLQSQLDRQQGVALSLEADESADLRSQRIPHRCLRDDPPPQPFRRQTVGIAHDDAVDLGGARDLASICPGLSEAASGEHRFDLVVESGEKPGAVGYLLAPAE